MTKVIVFDMCKNNLISIQTTCIGELTTRQELTPLPQISWILIPRNTKRPTLIPSSLLTRYDRLLRSGGGIPSLMDCLSEGEKERERDRYEVGVSCLQVRPTTDCGGLPLLRHSRFWLFFTVH